MTEERSPADANFSGHASVLVDTRQHCNTGDIIFVSRHIPPNSHQTTRTLGM